MVNNGKPTYVDPKKKTLETEMEFDKLQSYRKKQFDPKARPFYTKFQKYPEASFVFANDSRKGQKVFTIHTPHSMFGHHICALKGEILINPIHKGE